MSETLDRVVALTVIKFSIYKFASATLFKPTLGLISNKL